MHTTTLRSKSISFGVGQAPNRVEFVAAIYWDNATHGELPRTMMDKNILDALDRWRNAQQLGGGTWNLEQMSAGLLRDEKLGAVRVIVQDSFGHTSESFKSDTYAPVTLVADR